MIVPIGDSPNPRGTSSWVTWILLAANVAIYLLWTLPLSLRPLEASDPALLAIARDLGLPVRELAGRLSAWDAVVHAFGYKPGAPSVVTLLASLFLHANAAHVAGNALFLWIFGDNVEHRLGRVSYLTLYVGGGALATLFFSLFARGSLVPLVGASGAISAVLGCYLVFFPRNRVRILLVLPFVVRIVLVPATIVLGGYVLVDNLLPFLLTDADGGGVAYGAHLGGFGAGVAAALAAKALHFRMPRDAAGGEEEVEEAVERLRALLLAGRPRAALDLVRDAIRNARSGEEAARFALIGAQILARAGHESEAWRYASYAAEVAETDATRDEALAFARTLPVDPRLVDRLRR